MENIPEEIWDKLKKLSAVEFDMLVIEDYQQLHQAMQRIFQKAFPKAKIYFLKSFGGEQFEDQIVLREYQFFAMDANVAKLGTHPEYGINAFKAIPFIRKEWPESIIMGMSTSRESNEAALELGADFALEKEHINILLKLTRES